MKTKNLLECLLTFMIVLFGHHSIKAQITELGTAKMYNAPLYATPTPQDEIDLPRSSTVSYKIVTLGKKFWVYTSLSDNCTLTNNPWSAQIKINNNPGNERFLGNREKGVAFNRMSQSGSGNMDYEFPEDLQTLCVFQDFNNSSNEYQGQSFTKWFNYVFNVANNPSEDETVPVLVEVIKSSETNSVKFQFTASDNSHDCFYYINIKNAANGQKVAEEIAFTKNYIYLLPVGTSAGDYLFEVNAVDFDRNISNTVIAEEGIIMPDFNATDNLALNKISKASSNEGGVGGLVAGNGNDGNKNTRFTGAPTESSSDPQWWYVDLGNAYSINKISILWHASNTYPKDFKIQVRMEDPEEAGAISEDSWTSIYTETDYTPTSVGADGEYSHFLLDETKPARYVRIYTTQRVDIWGLGFFEFEVYGTGYYKKPDFVIQPGEIKTSEDYVSGEYGDIIFVDNGTDIGQLTITGTLLNVDGVVKLKKQNITPGIWYPMGFPFDVKHYYCKDFEFEETFDPEAEGPDLLVYNGTETTSATLGDFWVKTCDANGKFIYRDKMEAGKGYIVKFPSSFNKTEVTFISEKGVTLTNNTILSGIPDYYTMVANPLVSKVGITSITGSKYHYVYIGNNVFNLYTGGPLHILKPFESFITVGNSSPSSIMQSIMIEQVATGLDKISTEDHVVATRYYTLQGMEVRQPAQGSGIYIVKKIYDSQRTEVIKMTF